MVSAALLSVLDVLDLLVRHTRLSRHGHPIPHKIGNLPRTGQPSQEASGGPRLAYVHWVTFK